MENQENNNGQLQIELKEEVAQGTYANLAIITHSSSEFIMDFIQQNKLFFSAFIKKSRSICFSYTGAETESFKPIKPCKVTVYLTFISSQILI